MAFVEILFDNGLAVLTLTDSQHGNRLNKDSLEELTKAFTAAEKAEEVRVILIRSNGKTFCVGMDLDALLEKDKDLASQEHAISLYAQLLLSFSNSPKPVISLVQGEAKAGGVGLAAACDIVMASEEATFELAEVFFGLIPANVLPVLTLRRLPSHKAQYLAMTGTKLTAVDAKSLNLVDEVFPPEFLEKNLKSLIKRLLRASPRALEELKKLISQIAPISLENAFQQAQKCLLGLIRDPSTIKGIEALEEGNLPAWFSRFRPDKPLLWEENDE